MIEPGYYRHYRTNRIYKVEFCARLAKRPHQGVNKGRYKYLAEARFEFNGSNAELYIARSASARDQYMIDPVVGYAEIPSYFFNENCVVYTLLHRKELGYFIRSYTNFTATSPTGVAVFTRIPEPVPTPA